MMVASGLGSRIDDFLVGLIVSRLDVSNPSDRHEFFHVLLSQLRYDPEMASSPRSLFALHLYLPRPSSVASYLVLWLWPVRTAPMTPSHPYLW
jgi:hypothetical protein